MNGTYVLSEVRRVLRNRRYLVFSLAMPVLLFLVISSGDDGGTLDGLHVAPYIMVSMATFGALSAVFSTAGRIATERSTGWHRQLRLTALTGRAYLLAKVVTGFVLAVPSVLVVFGTAAVVDGVRLPADRWLAAGATILLTLLPVAVLGIALGYTARADNLQAVAGGVISLLALLGGLWVPLETFPSGLQDVARLLPMSWVADGGRAALQGSWVGWHGTAVLAAWTAVLAVVAARAYDRDALRG